MWVTLSNSCLSTNTILVTHQAPVIQISANKYIWLMQVITELPYSNLWWKTVHDSVCSQLKNVHMVLNALEKKSSTLFGRIIWGLILCTNWLASIYLLRFRVFARTHLHVRVRLCRWVRFKLSSTCQLLLPCFTPASSSSTENVTLLGTFLSPLPAVTTVL